jgi:tetratricopeptide (TPR) repeat protein
VALVLVLVVVAALTGSIPSRTYAKGASTEQVRAVVEPVVNGLNERSTEELTAAIDLPAIWQTVFRDIDVSTEFKNGFITGFDRSFGENLRRMLDRIPERGYAKLLRVEEKRALVRIDFGENGYMYREFHFAPDYEGRLRIVNWYDYSMGQMFSDSVRQLILVSAPDTSMLKRILDVGDDDTQQLLELFQALGARDFEKFATSFEALPDEIRNSRIMQIVAIQVAQQSGDMNRYQMALRLLATHHRDDPTLTFLLLDHYFLEGQYDLATELLDRLQHHLGVEDAGVLGMKANTLMMARKLNEAIVSAKRAVELEPSLEAPHWSLLKSCSLAERYEEAVAAAKKLESNFGYVLDAGAFSTDPDYQSFTQSQPFSAWQASR